MRDKNVSNLQNKKCYECKFCLWHYEYNSYKCFVKGCYENSKFVEYDLRKYIEEVKELEGE